MSNRIQITDRLAFDSNMSYGWNQQDGGKTFPVDFSSGSQVVYTQVVPGGALGPNGYLEIYWGGTVAITSSVAMTAGLQYTATQFATVTQPLSTGVTWFFEARTTFRNLNSETSNLIHTSIILGRNAAGSAGPWMNETTTSVDTTVDVTFVAYGTMAAAVTTAAAEFAHGTVQYLP